MTGSTIGQGTFLSNPSHRPDHIEVMDDWPGLKSLMLAWHSTTGNEMDDQKD